ncbi:hypothetical protein, partial [Rhodococcus rhodochrous]|uniref:hypothetical protein n=1 Tax=Rhodococcus rhodochrous TaxID=1829 RepID=UPI00351EDC2D
MLTEVTAAHDGHRLGYTLDAQQSCLDLTELNPLTSELHLEIGATQILQLTVSRPPHQITRAIHPLAGAEGIGHEPLRRQIHPPVITPRELNTRQIQLTR